MSGMLTPPSPDVIVSDKDTGCLKKKPVSGKMAITSLWKELGAKVG